MCCWAKGNCGDKELLARECSQVYSCRVRCLVKLNAEGFVDSQLAI